MARALRYNALRAGHRLTYHVGAKVLPSRFPSGLPRSPIGQRGFFPRIWDPTNISRPFEEQSSDLGPNTRGSRAAGSSAVGPAPASSGRQATVHPRSLRPQAAGDELVRRYCHGPLCWLKSRVRNAPSFQCTAPQAQGAEGRFTHLRTARWLCSNWARSWSLSTLGQLSGRESSIYDRASTSARTARVSWS